MKIVYVHHCGSAGGAGNSLFYLLSKLIAFHEIHVITQRGEMADRFRSLTPNVYEIKGVPVLFTMAGFGMMRTVFSNIKALIYLKELGHITSLISNIKPELVHLNEIGMFSTARRIKRVIDIPVVMHARTVPNSNNSLLLKYFSRQCNKYVDQLLCISKSVAYQYPKVRNKVVVYNPLHVDETQVNQIAQIDYHTKPLKVLFLANFYRQKGIGETIKSVIALRNEPNIHFQIIGSNTRSKRYFKSIVGILLDKLDIYPDYEARLIKAFRVHKLKNVTWLGQVSSIKSVIQECQLLIAPMHLNGTPRSVFEAGIYGIPSILALRDKIDDLVENGINGLVISEKNQIDLVKAILGLERDRGKLSELGSAAKVKFNGLCSQDRVANDVNELYQNVLERFA